MLPITEGIKQCDGQRYQSPAGIREGRMYLLSLRLLIYTTFAYSFFFIVFLVSSVRFRLQGHDDDDEVMGVYKVAISLTFINFPLL